MEGSVQVEKFLPFSLVSVSLYPFILRVLSEQRAGEIISEFKGRKVDISQEKR